MEKVNNNYYKLNVTDIFKTILNSSEEQNEEKLSFFSNLNNLRMDTEKDNNIFIEDIYFEKEFVENNEYFSRIKKVVTRDSIVNSIVYALTHDEFDIAERLSGLVELSHIDPLFLGDLQEFVLTNSMNLDELYGNEKERFIYNQYDNTIEKGYIYTTKTKKLKK